MSTMDLYVIMCTEIGLGKTRYSEPFVSRGCHPVRIPSFSDMEKKPETIVCLKRALSQTVVKTYVPREEI